MKTTLLILSFFISLSAFSQKKDDSLLVLKLNENGVVFLSNLMQRGQAHLFDDNSMGAKSAADISLFADSLRVVFNKQYLKWHPEPAKVDSIQKK